MKQIRHSIHIAVILVIFLAITGIIAETEANAPSAKIPSELPIPASDGALCGYINTRGTFVIPPKFADAQPFNIYGVATVYAPGFQQTDFIDRFGKTLFSSPKGTQSDGYSAYYADEFLKFRTKATAKTGFINKNGEITISAEWDDAGTFNQHALAPVKKDGKWGFIDRMGKLAVPLQYSYADSFQDNKAYVTTGLGAKADRIYLLKDGTTTPYTEMQSQTRNDVAIGQRFGTIKFNSEGFGIAAYRVGNKQTGYALFSKPDAQITPPIYDRLIVNERDKTFVVETNKLYGVIDEKGKIIIPISFSYLEKIGASDQFIAKQNGTYGVLNRSGKWMTKRRFTQMGFCGPQAAVLAI